MAKNVSQQKYLFNFNFYGGLCFVIPPHYPTLHHNSTICNEYMLLVLGKLGKRTTDMEDKALDTSSQTEEDGETKAS